MCEIKKIKTFLTLWSEHLHITLLSLESVLLSLFDSLILHGIIGMYAEINSEIINSLLIWHQWISSRKDPQLQRATDQ